MAISRRTSGHKTLHQLIRNMVNGRICSTLTGWAVPAAPSWKRLLAFWRVAPLVCRL